MVALGFGFRNAGRAWISTEGTLAMAAILAAPFATEILSPHGATTAGGSEGVRELAALGQLAGALLAMLRLVKTGGFLQLLPGPWRLAVELIALAVSSLMGGFLVLAAAWIAGWPSLSVGAGCLIPPAHLAAVILPTLYLRIPMIARSGLVLMCIWLAPALMIGRQGLQGHVRAALDPWPHLGLAPSESLGAADILTYGMLVAALLLAGSLSARRLAHSE